MLIKKEKDLEDVLDELFTDSEIDKLQERIRILACLKDGMSQRETRIETDAGFATISRAAQMLKDKKLKIDDYIEQGQKMSWWYNLFWRS